MTRMTAQEALEDFEETIQRVADSGERIVLSRQGKDVAAVVSVEDLKRLQALEDQADLADLRQARAEPGSVTLEQLKAELGLK